jgi:ADP-ribose pyrophosphatase
METWIDNQIVYKGKIVSLRTGTVRLDNGDTAKREVVEHQGGVAIIPVLDGSVLLVRQFRIAVGRELAELPAGKLEPGETPEVCAGRELQEEISYRPGRLIPSPSVSVGFAAGGCTSSRPGHTSRRDA